MILSTVGLFIMVAGLSFRMMKLSKQVDALRAKIHRLEFPLD